MSNLPAPEFAARDPESIARELVALYEEMAGRTLQPAQVERLIIDLIAYRESLLRQSIQETGEQTLLAFARAQHLDWIAQLYGITRLPARAAVTMLRFELDAALPDNAFIIPAGERVRTKDGRFDFATDEDLVIAPGDTAGEIAATATEPGTAANGYRAGEIKTLVKSIPELTVENVTPTFGGAAVEDDDRFRARIQEAPERLSVAGPVGAYRWHALSAHQEITDAAVTSPEPGVVRVSVLTRDGLPSDTRLDQVRAILTDERVRPLTDLVEVVAPARVAYALTAAITLKRDADAQATLAAAREAAETYTANRRAGLGRDIVPSQIVAALSVPGVYDVHLDAPAWRVLSAHEWADAESVAVEIAGVADG